MSTPLYNSRGTWSVATQYNYLDSVTYGKYTYICTEISGSIAQLPSTYTSVWVQMPVVTQEDQYYLRSREELLQYEDARFQSLINAMTNYYTTANDQSEWGAFLRAVAMELARIEYMYSYYIVSKDPQYLTPPDIKREYSNPLFVTGTFQQNAQFDSGDFGASFGQWAAVTGVIFRTAIQDTNGNIQIATQAGETGALEPSWAVQEGLTTVDNTVVWTNAGAAPAALAYPIGYKDMLIDLLAAYQEGATPKSIQDVIYAYTGKNIIVEELYKEIVPGGFYDQSDRNAIKVSVGVGGDDPLTEIENLTELQQITNSLYGAMDLAKPAHVGLEFTTIFGVDENIDCFISPRYLTQYQLDTLTASQQLYYVLIGYVLANPSVLGWHPNTLYAAGSLIQDTNGNIQYSAVGGVTGTVAPVWATTLENATPDDGDVIWINIGTPQITIAAYQALPSQQQAVYQAYYQNLNCVGTGIDDTLRIIIQQYEEPPFDPMLYQAPILDPTNPTTTLASYGRHILSPLSQAAWTALQVNPVVWSGSSTYNKGALVRGLSVMTSGVFNAGGWTPGGWQLYRALKKSTNQPVSNTAYWLPLTTPSIYQAYYNSGNNQYVTGITSWSPVTAFYTGQYMIDNEGSLQIASTQGVSSPIVNVSSNYQSVMISNNVLTVVIGGNGTAGMGLVANVSTVILLGFTFATFLNGQYLQVVSFTQNSISMTIIHDNYTSGSQLESAATIQIAFSQSATVPTYDGTIVWQYLGVNNLNNPAKWIQVVDSTDSVTGEVANSDVHHQMGLLAPRTDLVWEIGGGDYLNEYEEE